MNDELIKGISGLIVIVIVVLCVVLLSSNFNKCTREITDTHDQMESKVGSTVVIDKDTLIVVDFSWIKDCYILNNGLSVNRAYVDSIK